MNSLKEIAKVLKNQNSAVIFTHMRPDGDTVGSAVALSRALSLIGIRNEALGEEDIPERFFYLDGASEVKTAPSFDADCFICVDSSSESRLGLLRDTYLAGAKKKTTVNIDHHVSNTRFAKYNYVKECPSNCENIARLIKELGVPYDKAIAEALMTGMITDSGGFSHGDVNGDTFRAAGEVADAGADVNKIYYEAMKKQSRPRAQFYLTALSRLRFLLDDALTVVVVPQSLLNEFGLKPDATEGLVDFGLTIESTEVSICLLEVRKGQYKVSFRSKGKVNVNEVAGLYGGGGHVLASGCMLFGEEEEIVDKLRYAVYQRL